MLEIDAMLIVFLSSGVGPPRQDLLFRLPLTLFPTYLDYLRSS